MPSLPAPTRKGRNDSLERLIAEDSQEDLQILQTKSSHKKKQGAPRVSINHRGSSITLPTGGPTPADRLLGDPRRKRYRDESAQTGPNEQEKKLRQQQLKLKKLTQDNLRLETQVRGYEQRFRDMRHDAAYHDLTGGEHPDGGVCAPVKDAWRSFKNLFYTAWFQCWFKIQVKLEEKHRQLSKEENDAGKMQQERESMTDR
ncbi:uncharacterized protein LOC129602043 [Paramacrobiotus metropolitanus]|uniref:uncharacterized protein LOC129602043 n=1 Tax=Paramacrobiotus metropolitanus TaxID=2943436 RepID=UPI002445949C|nr:uncharacterized protein LOC129602043 [Paramacrobiotus metropolitanus]